MRYQLVMLHGTALIVDTRGPRVIATGSDADDAESIVDAMNFAPVRAQMAEALSQIARMEDDFCAVMNDASECTQMAMGPLVADLHNITHPAIQAEEDAP